MKNSISPEVKINLLSKLHGCLTNSCRDIKQPYGGAVTGSLTEEHADRVILAASKYNHAEILNAVSKLAVVGS